MVLNKNILSIGRYICAGDKVETLEGFVGLAIAEVRFHTEVADIRERLGLIAVVQAERQREDLADIVVNLGDDIDHLLAVIVHDGLVVMILTIRINVLDLLRRDGYLGGVNRIYRRFGEIDHRVITICLFVIAKSTDEEVVGVVVHTTGHILPIPTNRLGELHLTCTLRTFLIGCDDIFHSLVALHPNISGSDAGTRYAGDLDDVFGDIQRTALFLYPIGIPLQCITVIH